MTVNETGGDPERLAPLIAVVGTDTGVGKTVLATGLIHAMRQAGVRVAAFKPVETGLVEGKLSDGPADWERLAEASGQDPQTCLGESYPLPAAPLAAARAAGETVQLTRLTAHLHRLRQDHELLVVEGAGGLCVPLAEGTTWADALELWAPACVVVGRLGLGTINHTLLTLSDLAHRHLQVEGVVLNTLSKPGPETTQTPDLIAEFGGSPVWGVIPEGCVSPAKVSAVLQDCGLVGRLISQYKSG